MLRRNHPHGRRAAAVEEVKRLTGKVEAADFIWDAAGYRRARPRGSISRILGECSSRGAPAFDFRGRNRRPPRDPVNAVLSFVYSMLMRQAMVSAMAVGFDPYMGFYHQPKYGRPALALDLAEEFRPLIADSAALTLFNNSELKEKDFIRRAGAVSLTPGGTKGGDQSI